MPNPVKDPLHAINICAGFDSLRKIGEPQNAGMRSNSTVEQLWQEACEQNFKNS